MSFIPKPILRAFIFFLFFTTSSFAQNCAELLEMSTWEPWETTRLQVGDFKDGDQNAFSESLPSTVVSGLVWLSAVQLLRSHVDGGKFFTPAFNLTVPVDLTLTAVSHAIALSPWLSQFVSGKAFGPRFEFAARAGANTVMGTTVIVSTWAASGIDITLPHACAAAALCAAVYPSLQWIKTGLFKAWPKQRDAKLLSGWRATIPREIDRLLERVESQAKELGLPENLTDKSLVESIDALVLSVPYEERNLFTGWNGRRELAESLAEKSRALRNKILSETSPDQLEKWGNELKQLRRKLVKEILAHAKSPESILALGGAFTPESSLLLQQALQDRSGQNKWRIVASSFVDQMVAVGVAGGVFLYGVNHWAKTGEVPWFF